MRFLSLAVSGIGAIILSGCAGMHLHTEEDAKLAKQAQENYAKIDPMSLIATARANLGKLRDAEIERDRENIEYLRDLTLYDLLAAKAKSETPPPKASDDQKAASAKAGRDLLVAAMSIDRISDCADDKFPNQGKCYLHNRIAELGFSSREDLVKMLGKFQEGPLGNGWSREIAEVLAKLTTWKVPACSKLTDDMLTAAVDGAPENSKSIVELRFKALVVRCRAGHEANTILAESKVRPNSEIDIAVKRIGTATTALETIDAESSAIAKRIETLEAELDSVIKAAGPGADERKKKLVEEVRDLRKSVDKIENAAAKIGALKGIADTQLTKLNLLLGAAAGETIPQDKLNSEEGLRKAALLAQSIPGLAAEIGAAVDAWKSPVKPSLLVAKGQALIDKQDAVTQERLVKQRLDLYRTQLQALLAEAGALKEAGDLAIEYRTCTEAGRVACDQYSLRAYSALWTAFIPYRLESVTAARQDTHYDAEAIMQANEYALRSWDNLVRTPLEVLQAFHAGGLKPAELADLFMKAGGLGLLAIITGKVD